jgi:hypothetical protein
LDCLCHFRGYFNLGLTYPKHYDAALDMVRLVYCHLETLITKYTLASEEVKSWAVIIDNSVQILPAEPVRKMSRPIEGSKPRPLSLDHSIIARSKPPGY